MCRPARLQIVLTNEKKDNERKSIEKMLKYSVVEKKLKIKFGIFFCKNLQCHLKLKHAKFHCHISMGYGSEIQSAKFFGYLCVMIVMIVITSVEVVV